VAAKDPQAIHTLAIDIDTGLMPHDAISFAKRIGFSKPEEAADVMIKLYKLFIQKDALLVEINPFCEITVPSGDKSNRTMIACLDAKLNFDDNADFRQEAIHKMRDITQEDEREIKAAEHKLNYIGLDGTIGCLVNGAGLAMATMDMIKLHGGEPANFLDVGGGATAQQVTEAFKILTSDPRVSSILVNIFGGIMRCDIIAEGIIEAVNKLGLSIPLVVRLQGTRVQEAKELISKSKLKIFASDDLTEAATRAVCLSNIVANAKKGNIKLNFEL
jgi:succinyl-CoA synthetase beta subunit